MTPHELKDLARAEHLTKLWARGEYNYPDTPEDSMDNRILEIDSLNRVYLFTPYHEWKKRPYHRGWQHTEEARQKISEARKRYWANKKRRTVINQSGV